MRVCDIHSCLSGTKFPCRRWLDGWCNLSRSQQTRESLLSTAACCSKTAFTLQKQGPNVLPDKLLFMWLQLSTRRPWSCLGIGNNPKRVLDLLRTLASRRSAFGLEFGPTVVSSYLHSARQAAAEGPILAFTTITSKNSRAPSM